ncbi:MAG: GTPase ObgE [Limnochordaceae bacterium]|nr:GTPase ObgE [Limnochordaceae bacterium]
MIDKVRLELKAGDGGQGAVSFRREKYVPFGGPDGGDGGRGGHIYIEAKANTSTLIEYRYHRRFTAPNGGDGGGALCHGRDGEDLILYVPPGTVVKDEATGEVLADLVEAGQRVLVATGGQGGRGNAHFATPSRQAPRIAERGRPGEQRVVICELKLIADVGLVGLPNAGKSSLLARVSAARPKIADYPFTTLQPQLGVVARPGRPSFVLADIPGLIEGAHTGAGLGHEFLRHVERTRLLVHVVDLSGLYGVQPEQAYQVIRRELALYSPPLANRPELVAANKIDLAEGRANLEGFRRYLTERGVPPENVFPISAATGEGVESLLDRVAQWLDQHPVTSQKAGWLPPRISPPAGTRDHTTETADQTRGATATAPRQLPPRHGRAAGKAIFDVRKGEQGWIVESDAIDRYLERFRVDTDEALLEFLRWLRRQGMDEALQQAGVKDGDTVCAGPYEFEYWE